MAMHKIKQIAPATGWSGLYVNSRYVTEDLAPGEDVVQALPLACWALIEDEDGERRVVGIRGGEAMDIVEHDLCWIGYLGPGESVDDATRERARTQLAFVRTKVRGAA